MKVNKEFTAYFFSNVKTDTTNTLSHFTSYLPTPLKLNKKYQIALEEVGIHFNYVSKKKPQVQIPSKILGFIIVFVIDGVIKYGDYLKSYDIYTFNEKENFQACVVHIPENATNIDVIAAFEDAKKRIMEAMTIDPIDRDNPHTLTELNYPFHVEEVHNKLCFYSNLDKSTPSVFPNYFVLINRDVRKRFKMPVYDRLESKYLSKDVQVLFIVGKVNKPFRIQASTPFDRNSISIECDIMDQKIEDEKFSRTLKQFHLRDGATFMSKQFQNLEFHPISLTDISKIRFDLVNSLGHLDLPLGSPTYLKVRFKQMDTPKFHIQISSKDSIHYGKNTPYSFKKKLPEVLELSNRWQVALTSFSCPSQIFFSKMKDPIEIWYTLEENNRPAKKYIYASKYCKSYRDILEPVNKFLAVNKLGNIGINDSNKLTLTKRKPFELLLPYPINIILGWEDNLTEQTGTMLYGSDDENLFLASYSVDDMYTYIMPKYFMIYTNIIEDAITGEIQSRLLQLISITDKDLKNTVICKEFDHKTYHDLSVNNIRDIEVEIRGVDGEFIQFESSFPVTMNLEFSLRK